MSDILSLISFYHCVGPENIQTPNTEKTGNSRGVGWGSNKIMIIIITIIIIKILILIVLIKINK